MTGAQTVFRSLVIACGLLAASCNDNPAAKFIQKGTFNLSDDLMNASFSLAFTDQVQAPFDATFPIKTYGSVFATPYVDAAHTFEVGMNLNLQALYDNDFAQMTPTSTLPNGMSFPVKTPFPLIEVDAGSIVSGVGAKVLAYLDIKAFKWLGLATMVRGLDKNFPANLEVSQVFLFDKQGAPALVGTFFGPKLANDGTVERSGGLAIFANVKALAELRGSSRQPMEIRPEGPLEIRGARAEYYRTHPAELQKAAEAMAKALSELK